MSEQQQWDAMAEYSLTRENLQALLENRIPAIRIRGFANAEECAAFKKAMETANLKSYKLARPVQYIGMAQVEYRWDGSKEDYFRDVVSAYEDQAYVFRNAFDPIQRLIARLSECWPADVEIASEPDFGDYFAGIIRIASHGIDLHADYAPFNTPGYVIEHINAQLGWNLFVEAPGAGGITSVHNAPWTPVMDGDTPPQSYGLDRSIVAGAQVFQYAPAAGDVVLFNSRNPHEVSAGEGDGAVGRLQVGSFIGRMPDERLVLWA